MNIKITCKCGEEIEVNPASMLGKLSGQKRTREDMVALAKRPRKKRGKFKDLRTAVETAERIGLPEMLADKNSSI